MTAEEIKTIRQSLKLSQRALAARLGLSERQYVRYEAGDSLVPPPVAILIDIMVAGKIPKNLK